LFPYTHHLTQFLHASSHALPQWGQCLSMEETTYRYY
jgi:hypothetical protein